MEEEEPTSKLSDSEESEVGTDSEDDRPKRVQDLDTNSPVLLRTTPEAAAATSVNIRHEEPGESETPEING